MVLLYALWVLIRVATLGDLGMVCLFSPTIEEVTDPESWTPEAPEPGSQLIRMGPVHTPRTNGDATSDRIGLEADAETVEVREFPDVVEAMRRSSRWRGGLIQVVWVSPEGGPPRTAQVQVQPRPWLAFVRSVVWLILQVIILVIGALVWLGKPRDPAASRFYWVCVCTVGAFIGGYHWLEIIVDFWLIAFFAGFAITLPFLSLAFYLVFPRLNPLLYRSPRLIGGLLAAVPCLMIVLLWGTMLFLQTQRSGDLAELRTTLESIRVLALTDLGLCFLTFVLCVVCLGYSYLRAESQAERNQVRWICIAATISVWPLGLVLYEALWVDPVNLARESTAWILFVVSLVFTLSYASMIITRYRLMEANRIINRGMIYFVFSVLAGLVYSSVPVLTALAVGGIGRWPSTSEAVVFGVLAIAALVVWESLRSRFNRALERRLRSEQSHFDQALRRMTDAVQSLVDRRELSGRLLAAAVEGLRVEWAAIYLNQSGSARTTNEVGADGPDTLVLTNAVGPEPDRRQLGIDDPLVRALKDRPIYQIQHAPRSDLVADVTIELIRLGGEVAVGLPDARGELVGLIVLGPKRNGRPYLDEERAFLKALRSLATVSLHASTIQTTLTTLNDQLRVKADLVAQQQRRILVLQGQLAHRIGDSSDPTVVTDPMITDSDVAETDPDSAEDRRDQIDSAVGARDPRSSESTPALPIGDDPFARLIGRSASLHDLIRMAAKVAQSESAVLIRGESGTGKERLAEALHRASARREGPLIRVHCGALSASLLESELFGHVRGAFTGADRDRVGRFEEAHGGTILLDEIGDIALETQIKLLRVLQERVIERVGSSRPIAVDVRILAATHRDLESMIDRGTFRLDLYYRLNVISLIVPPLRQRPEDIIALALHFQRQQAIRLGRPIAEIDPDAMEALLAYPWPGNVRELENAMERAVVLTEGDRLTLDDLPPALRTSTVTLSTRSDWLIPTRSAIKADASTHSLESPLYRQMGHDLSSLSDHVEVHPEREQLLRALRDAGGNKSEAARLLGMPRSTLFSKLKRYGIRTDAQP